jgi:FkbM family methyltransferase
VKFWKHKYWWHKRESWALPDGEEMMQAQLEKCLDDQIQAVTDAVFISQAEHPPRTCVQAGGAFGLYPLALSQFFKHVITFEPLLENLQCMAVNIGNDPRITVEEYPLWDSPDVELRMDYTIRKEKNSYGAHHVSFPHQAPQIAQRVTTVTLDQYELKDVDLIWLDIEGAELRALRGACGTITRNRPVIVLEDREFSQMRQYGVRKGDATRWLCNSWNYKVAGKTAADTILVPK